MSTENYVNKKPKITVIPAKPRQEIVGRQSVNGEKPKLRVAAYARVSTDHEEQESSYEAQVKHFTEYITQREDWQLAGIYADPGLSGKNIKRPQFQKLMRDCEQGKIDRIITKSVSRFARNTLDCVKCVRKLKEKGIGVYFEKENLDTLQEGSEFVLTIMASLAEEESRSISNNIRWSVKKKFENGKLLMSTAHFLGYEMENGVLKIIPEQAMIVRRIYAEFLDGYSLKEICEGLERDGILSPSGKTKWHATTVASILTNEKYKGDCHLQKTYLPDFLSPHRIKNEGQADSYYVEDSHAAIISKEMFDMVQQERMNRKNLRSGSATGKGKFSGKYAFSGMIICGECGETYRRHQQYSGDKKYYIWVCKTHENTGKGNCPAKPIKEKALEEAFVRALNRLMENSQEILDEVRLAAETEITDSCEAAVEEVQKQIEEAKNALATLLQKRSIGLITPEEYEAQSKKLKNDIDMLNFRKEATLTEQSTMQLAEYRTAAVVDLLTNGTMLQEFDKVIFKSLVKRITVLNRQEIEIEFECGIKVKETL